MSRGDGEKEARRNILVSGPRIVRMSKHTERALAVRLGGGAPWLRDPILIGIQWLFCMHSPMEQMS